jgi:molybdopterin-guanine dinucleotide biosynthesis protein A
MANKSQEISCIVLAGGMNTRIGRQKAFLRIGGATLFDHQMKVLNGFFKEIIIVTNEPENFKNFDGKVVRDIIPGLGPLGGLYSGLAVSSCIYSLLMACDMPFINLELLKYMISQINRNDIVIPRSSKGVETLFAIYSINCLESIKRQIDTRHLKLVDILNSHNVRFITREEIQDFDPRELTFININTFEEYVGAKSIWKRIIKHNQTS